MIVEYELYVQSVLLGQRDDAVEPLGGVKIIDAGAVRPFEPQAPRTHPDADPVRAVRAHRAEVVLVVGRPAHVLAERVDERAACVLKHRRVGPADADEAKRAVVKHVEPERPGRVPAVARAHVNAVGVLAELARRVADAPDVVGPCGVAAVEEALDAFPVIGRRRDLGPDGDVVAVERIAPRAFELDLDLDAAADADGRGERQHVDDAGRRRFDLGRSVLRRRLLRARGRAHDQQYGEQHAG